MIHFPSPLMLTDVARGCFLWATFGTHTATAKSGEGVRKWRPERSPPAGGSIFGARPLKKCIPFPRLLLLLLFSNCQTRDFRARRRPRPPPQGPARGGRAKTRRRFWNWIPLHPSSSLTLSPLPASSSSPGGYQAKTTKTTGSPPSLPEKRRTTMLDSRISSPPPPLKSCSSLVPSKKINVLSNSTNSHEIPRND